MQYLNKGDRINKVDNCIWILEIGTSQNHLHKEVNLQLLLHFHVFWIGSNNENIHFF